MPIVSTALLVAALSVGCAAGPNRAEADGVAPQKLIGTASVAGYTDEEFSPVQKVLMRRFLMGEVRVDEEGSPSYSIICSSLATYGYEPDSVEFEFFDYSHRLSGKFVELVDPFGKNPQGTDPEFQKLFQEIERTLLAQLDRDVSELDGRMQVYDTVLRTGFYHRLINDVPGSPKVAPAGWGLDRPWGRADKPFYLSVPDDRVTQWPESVLRHYYCDGMADTEAKGFTIKGGPSDPFVLTIHELIAENPSFRDTSFREAWLEVLKPLQEEVDSLSPTDMLSRTRLTSKWRRRLLESGLADFIYDEALKRQETNREERR